MNKVKQQLISSYSSNIRPFELNFSGKHLGMTGIKTKKKMLSRLDD